MGQDVDSCEALFLDRGDFHFEHAVCHKCVFPFPLSIAELLGDYFGIRRYGANKTFLLITH